jgi:hypothetical protein
MIRESTAEPGHKNGAVTNSDISRVIAELALEESQKMKWEYLCVESNHKFSQGERCSGHWLVNNRVTKEFDGKSWVGILNHFGNQGWEMIFSRDGDSDIEFYFKRPFTVDVVSRP